MAVLFTACKKYEITIPPTQAHFMNQTGATYFILTPTTTFKVPVGVTTVSNVDRTVTFSVSSPTGAVAGTHYNLTGNTVTIKAGQAVDSIEVRGVFSMYATGRKDTLVFTINEGGAKASEYNKEYKLLMRGPCFDGDVALSDLLGVYSNTNEIFGNSPYGPYETTISAVSNTSATTGTITVTNIWDNGWNPIVFKLNWSNPSNITVTLDPQTGIGDAGTVSSTYAGRDISVRAHAVGGPGTFSVCSQTLTLRLQIGVTGLGYFSQLYTVTMAR